MLFTKASEYPLMAIIAISKQNGAADAVTLSSDLKLSYSFLAKLLQALAKAGILASRKGAGGARIAFIHPKAAGGILLELCER